METLHSPTGCSSKSKKYTLKGGRTEREELYLGLSRIQAHKCTKKWSNLALGRSNIFLYFFISELIFLVISFLLPVFLLLSLSLSLPLSLSLSFVPGVEIRHLQTLPKQTNMRTTARKWMGTSRFTTESIAAQSSNLCANLSCQPTLITVSSC